MEHSLIPPSSLPVVVKCAGSLLMCSAVPDEETEKQRQGTAAHWVGQQCLLSYSDPNRDVVIRSDFVGKAAPNGVIVDDEMWDAVQVLVDDVLAVCSLYGVMSQLHIEERTGAITEIHDQCWGTPDVWVYVPGIHTLFLWDFKYGHTSVVAFENAQLIAYVLDAIRKSGFVPLSEQAPVVDMRIVAPRCYSDDCGPMRTWATKAVELRPYVNLIASKVAEAVTGTASCVTGSHCRHCAATAICPALRHSGGAVVDMIESVSIDEPSDESLAYEMVVLDRAADLLKARREAMEVLLEHRLRNGIKVPGWTLEPTFTKNQWNDPSTIVSIGDVLGIDLRDGRPVTPAEAKRRCKAANVDDAVIAGLYSQPPGSLKPKFDDGSKARQVFQKGASS